MPAAAVVSVVHACHSDPCHPSPTRVQSHRSLVEGVSSLARRVQADRELTNLIRRKFAIKCTTGACGLGVW